MRRSTIDAAMLGIALLVTSAAFGHDCSSATGDSRYPDGRADMPSPVGPFADGYCETRWTYDPEGRFGWHLWYPNQMPFFMHPGIAFYQCMAAEVHIGGLGPAYFHTEYRYDDVAYYAQTGCEDNGSQCELVSCETYFDCFDCGSPP